MTTKTEILKVIAEYCRLCLGGEENPKNCTAPDCRLYPFRRGRDPSPRKLTRAELEARRKGGRKSLVQV